MAKKNNSLKGQDYVKAMLAESRENIDAIETEVSPFWTNNVNLFSGKNATQFLQGNHDLCVMGAFYGYESHKWATSSQVSRNSGTIINKDDFVRVARFNPSTNNWSFVDLYNEENISLPKAKVKVSPKVKVTPKVEVSEDTEVEISPKVEVSPKVTTKRTRTPLRCTLPNGFSFEVNNRTQMKEIMKQAAELGWC